MCCRRPVDDNCRLDAASAIRTRRDPKTGLAMRASDSASFIALFQRRSQIKLPPLFPPRSIPPQARAPARQLPS